jgi:putative MATE family efflux protein
LKFGFDRELTKRAFNLAFPVILGMMSQTVMGIVDTAMVGRLGAEALAATGLASAICFGFINFFSALGVGTQALTARRYGEDEKIKCGMVLFNALFIAFIIGIPVSLLGFGAAKYVFPYASKDVKVVEYGIAYIEYRFLGLLFIIVNVAFSRFFDGIGNTKIYMRAAILINGLNIIFDYLFIFGHLGFPRLEVKGAAIASTFATMIGSSYYLLVSRNGKYLRVFEYFRPGNLDSGVIRGISKISCPPAIQSLLSMGGFFTFLWIVGRVGTIELASTTIIFSIISLSFMTGMGFGTAAATLIGQYMGAKKFDLAERGVWESVKLGALFLGAFGLIFILFPELLLKTFTNDQNVIRVGVWPLRIVGLIQALDAFRIVLEFALQAAGNPQWVMFWEVGVNWTVLVPLTYLLTIKWEYGVNGAWVSINIFVLLLALSMIWKFKEGKWKKISF